MKKQRPVFLDLTQIQLPAAAFSSILHRVSGLIMFIAVGFLLWLLHQSLQSQSGFQYAQRMLEQGVAKVLLWGVLTAFVYHLFAGIRHMVMDAGYWEELHSGTLSAKITIVLSVVASIGLGVWLWG